MQAPNASFAADDQRSNFCLAIAPPSPAATQVRAGSMHVLRFRALSFVETKRIHSSGGGWGWCCVGQTFARSVVLLLDISGSMGGQPLQNARLSIAAALREVRCFLRMTSVKRLAWIPTHMGK